MFFVITAVSSTQWWRLLWWSHRHWTCPCTPGISVRISNHPLPHARSQTLLLRPQSRARKYWGTILTEICTSRTIPGAPTTSYKARDFTNITEKSSLDNNNNNVPITIYLPYDTDNTTRPTRARRAPATCLVLRRQYSPINHIPNSDGNSNVLRHNIRPLYIYLCGVLIFF